MIWARPLPFAEHEHLCGGLYGPNETYKSEWVRLGFAPTGTPGVQATKCERCRIAWVRAT